VLAAGMAGRRLFGALDASSQTKPNRDLVGAAHVARNRGGSAAGVGVGVRARRLPRIARASNSTSSAVLLPHLSLVSQSQRSCLQGQEHFCLSSGGKAEGLEKGAKKTARRWVYNYRIWAKAGACSSGVRSEGVSFELRCTSWSHALGTKAAALVTAWSLDVVASHHPHPTRSGLQTESHDRTAHGQWMSHSHCHDCHSPRGLARV
jgi:hypothetical protein